MSSYAFMPYGIFSSNLGLGTYINDTIRHSVILRMTCCLRGKGCSEQGRPRTGPEMDCHVTTAHGILNSRRWQGQWDGHPGGWARSCLSHSGPSPVPQHTEPSGASIVLVGGPLAHEEAGELWQKGGLQEGSHCGRLDYGCFLVLISDNVCIPSPQ